ncbi:MAG: cysteine-rich CWC family protein [Chlorobiaceae bacterium]|nr:cysteine-rich CWC family protein [Chlorobiaceae bacterium]NTV16715.1 cysteine-rich CWC family protein [Chlorobiaceae bacterium]
MTPSIEQTVGSGQTVTCPICGQKFTCELSSTCWCASRTVPTDVKEYLAERYETCICSICLDRLIANVTTGESP